MDFFKGKYDTSKIVTNSGEYVRIYFSHVTGPPDNTVLYYDELRGNFFKNLDKYEELLDLNM